MKRAFNLCLSCVSLFVLLVGATIENAAVAYIDAQIFTPVNGTIAAIVAVPDEERVSIINTQNGTISNLVDDIGISYSPIWDNSGQKLVYQSLKQHSVIINYPQSASDILQLFPGQLQETLFEPYGWSTDGQNIS